MQIRWESVLLATLPWKDVSHVPAIQLARAVWIEITSSTIMANVRSVPIGHYIACNVMALITSVPNVRTLISPKMGYVDYVLI